MVSVFYWGVIFQIHHDRENLMLGNDYQRIKDMNRYGGFIYITLSHNIMLLSSGWY